MSERWDFVVAGSGAGGACVAARLAQAGARVLLLERGARATPQRVAMDAVEKYYADAGFSASLGRAMLPVPTGRTLGGTTTINSGTCLKTPSGLLARWEREVPGFDAGGFQDRLDEAWRLLKVKRAPESTLSASSRVMMEGWRRAGFGAAEPLERCEEGCDGRGRCCFVCPSDAKMTSEKAFLRPLRGDPRLTVRTRAALRSVAPRRRGGGPVRLRWTDLEAGGDRAEECGALILAAGALVTPYFLRSARLGENHARAGDGLSAHPAMKVLGCFPERVAGWSGVPQGVGLLDPEDDAIRYEGVYTPPEMAAITLPLEGLRLKWWMDRFDRVATFGFMIRDVSRGSVRYPGGQEHPLIRYPFAEIDRRRMIRGLRSVAEAMFAAGAERVVVPLNRAHNTFDSPAALRAADLESAAPASFQMMAFHPLGTCAMGRVVDADLRAAPGVYVCDGSVVPESLGVNPQITIYAFALRLAAHLTGGRGAG